MIFKFQARNRVKTQDNEDYPAADKLSVDQAVSHQIYRTSLRFPP